MSGKRVIPDPNRVRKVPEGFGWLDHRLLREGWLEQMTAGEITVYAFLVLAADRHGVSSYRREKIARVLGMDIAEVARALGMLMKRDMVAFKPFSRVSPDGFHQVLEVPRCAVGRAEEKRRTGGTPEAIGSIMGNLLKGGCDGNKAVG
jgi:hypothetical protein